MAVVRRRFDRAFLDACLSKDNAIHVGEPETLTQHSSITYICACGVQPPAKNFRQLAKTGAKCEACTLKQKSDRREATCMRKYNVSHASKTASTKEKQVKTFRENLLSRKESLAVTHPDLLAEWDYTKNTIVPTELTAGSNETISWKCDKVHECGCPHEWDAKLYTRTGLKSGCPYCSNTRICLHRSILITHPSIAARWHPTLNGDLTPDQVSQYSDREVWWRCPETCPEGCPHDFQSTVGNQTAGNGCPCCCAIVKQHCVHTSLVTTHPHLAKEWHPTKNERAPETIGYGSHASAWWICAKGHEWQAGVYPRAAGNGCPSCKNKSEEKLLTWSSPRYPTKAQVKYPWCVNTETGRGLPFDFELCGNIILELHGRQHFIQVSNWRSPESQKERDDYKIKCALENGKHVICIDQEDVWNDTNDWETKLERAISELQTSSISTVVNIGTRFVANAV